MRIAFIPAKGTSLGLPNKNLLQLGNESLLERALKLAIKHGNFDKVVVSTESVTIVSEVELILQKFGIACKPLESGDGIHPVSDAVEIHFRSSHISGNLVKTIDVIMEYLALSGLKSGLLLLLQPTSPFRNDKELSKIFELHNRYPRSSIFSAKIVESPHPEKSFLMKMCAAGDYILEKVPSGISTPRQLLREWACPDGAYYLIPVSLVLEQRTLIAEPSIVFLREGFVTLNIDTIHDYEFARFLIDQGKFSEL